MAEIPVFKERRMTGIGASGLEESYFISSSYAGILRLSPNSSSTLLDLNDISIDETVNGYNHYEDDVSSALDNQFVTVSTSDGVLLDISISRDAVQFNNLYVLGAAAIPNIIVYEKADNKFTIDDINMPNRHLDGIDYSENEPTEYTADENILRENIDKYFFLMNTAEDNQPTKFEYVNAQTLIKKFTQEALSELNSLPAGSIHWIPVNLEQYQALLNKGNTHNSSALGANTLIRDFLLCDGSKYKNEDFPELAKILKNERVVYWDCSEDVMKAKAETNDYSDSKTFRVPDLRSMFIKYVVPSNIDVNDDDNYFINKGRGKKVNGKWDLGISNRVGSWEMDSSKNQEIIIDKRIDKHYHFIVLDNDSANQRNTKEFIKYSEGTVAGNPTSYYSAFKFSKAINGTDDWGWDKFNVSAKPLAKYGSAGRNRWGGYTEYTSCPECDCSPCRTHGGEQGPVSMIYTPSFMGGEWNWCNGIGFTCGYLLSIASHSNYKNIGTIDLSNYIGQTSWTLDREVSYNEIDWGRYNKISKGFYSTKESYIKTEADRYQLENSPEFYACLPLIKI